MADDRWTIDPDTVFLNHGSFGACPKSVLAAQADLRALMERDPVRFFTREVGPRWEASRDALAALVNADPDGLVFVNNATTGVNTVLRSVDWKAGDELLVIDQGYPACLNAARFVAERAGVTVVTAEVPFPIASPGEAVAAIASKASSKTRLAVIDHVTSPTAVVLPIAEIVAALDGIDVCVDGAHAIAMLDLDLRAIGAAYYTSNCHKWLSAPKGAAMLYVREDLRARTRPLVISHGASAPVGERFHREFDWTGTDDPTAVLSIPAAIEALGAPEVRRQNHALIVEARQVLLDAFGLEAPVPESMLGTMAAVPLPDSRAAAPDAQGMDPLYRRMYDEHRIQVPVFTWPEHPKRLVRISAQLYNRIEEYQALAKALATSLDSA